LMWRGDGWPGARVAGQSRALLHHASIPGVYFFDSAEFGHGVFSFLYFPAPTGSGESGEFFRIGWLGAFVLCGRLWLMITLRYRDDGRLIVSDAPRAKRRKDARHGHGYCTQTECDDARYPPRLRSAYRLVFAAVFSDSCFVGFQVLACHRSLHLDEDCRGSSLQPRGSNSHAQYVAAAMPKGIRLSERPQ